MSKIKINEISEFLDRLGRLFSNYSGFVIEVETDNTVPDYYGTSFLPLKIIVTDSNNGRYVELVPDSKGEIFITEPHELNLELVDKVHPYLIWRSFYLQSRF